MVTRVAVNVSLGYLFLHPLWSVRFVPLTFTLVFSSRVTKKNFYWVVQKRIARIRPYSDGQRGPLNQAARPNVKSVVSFAN